MSGLDTPALVIAVIGLPAVAALLTLLTSAWPTVRRWMGVLLALGQVVLVLGVVSVFDTPPSERAAAGPLTIAQLETALPWMSTVEPPTRLAVDGLNLYALLLLSVISLLALLTDLVDGPSRAGLRQTGIFGVSAAAAGFLLSRDLVLAAACHGTTALVLALVIHMGADARPRRPAALSFLVPGLLASGCLWMAAIWCRSASDGLSASVDALVINVIPSGAVVLLTLFLILHLPLVPLHRWQTHSCGEGAAYSGILLTGGLWTILGVSGWLRLGLPLSVDLFDDVAALLRIWGGLSALIAVAVAAIQRDLGDRLRWACVGLAGLVAVGLGSVDLAATSGALLLCAALGLPRASTLCLVRWLPAETGGRGLALWWGVSVLALTAVAGFGGFAGLLPLLTGGSHAIGSVVGSPVGPTAWPVWACLLASVALVGVLLAPVSGIAHREQTTTMPWPLRLGLIVAVGVALATGWQPAPVADWVVPDVQRILAHAPLPTEATHQPMDEQPVDDPEDAP